MLAVDQWCLKNNAYVGSSPDFKLSKNFRLEPFKYSYEFIKTSKGPVCTSKRQFRYPRLDVPCLSLWLSLSVCLYVCLSISLSLLSLPISRNTPLSLHPLSLSVSLSVFLSLTDVTVSLGFLLDSGERMVRLLIFISHTHTLIQSRNPSCDLHTCHYNSWQSREKHTIMETRRHMTKSCMQASQP